jgi:hypothetical protein
MAFSLTLSCDFATLVSLSLRSRFDAALAPYWSYQPSERSYPRWKYELTFPILTVDLVGFGVNENRVLAVEEEWWKSRCGILRKKTNRSASPAYRRKKIPIHALQVLTFPQTQSSLSVETTIQPDRYINSNRVASWLPPSNLKIQEQIITTTYSIKIAMPEIWMIRAITSVNTALFGKNEDKENNAKMSASTIGLAEFRDALSRYPAVIKSLSKARKFVILDWGGLETCFWELS